MRWQYRDPALAWLMAPAYACHLAEEFFGGFPVWIARIVGRPMTDTAFLAINAVAMAAMIGAIRAATRHADRGWMLVAIATVLVVNAFAHLAGSIVTASYSPGLVTGTVLYIPLGGLVLLRAWDQAPPPIAARGVTAGILIHALVFVIAALATR